jgi:hypothetical protein
MRARVTRTADVERLPEVSSVARNLTQLLDIVREWATNFDRSGCDSNQVEGGSGSSMPPPDWG